MKKKPFRLKTIMTVKFNIGVHIAANQNGQVSKLHDSNLYCFKISSDDFLLL